MTKEYQQFDPTVIGNTVSCATLARMLNELHSTRLTKKVTAHITKYFRDVKFLSAGIYGQDRRIMVGNLLIRELDGDIDLECPKYLKYVIRNVKLAYVKDLLIREEPINYINSKVTLDMYEDDNISPHLFYDDYGLEDDE